MGLLAAIDTTVLVVGIGGVAAAVIAIVVIVSPWKGVRNEGPLPTDVETRLLLGEDPQSVAADVDREEEAGASVHDLNPEADDEARAAPDANAAFAELERLGEEGPEPTDPPI